MKNETINLNGDEEFDWDTDEEISDQNSASSFASIALPAQGLPSKLHKVHGAGPSCSKTKLMLHFIGMGFSEHIVDKAVEGNEEPDPERILETLLTYSFLEKSPPGESVPHSSCSPEIGKGGTNEEPSYDAMEALSEEERKLLLLVEMGFSTDEAASAMDRCGPGASLVELTDSISAAQIAESSDANLMQQSHSRVENRVSRNSSCDFIPDNRKRKWLEEERKEKRMFLQSWEKEYENIIVEEDSRPTDFSIPTNMIGFGIPDDPWAMTQRRISDAATGPPYFYYENVALAPKGVWRTISRFLYDIEPEFVDSKHFCATTRKRGYIHNLPIHGRFPLQPLAPRSIHEALPMTRRWWPSWDQRKQLNCLLTCTATAKLTERIRSALAESSDPPPMDVQQYVLSECRRWNLVWVGAHKVAPLEPDEIEMLLGFPKNHTRGGGISRTDRFKSLGNSFQVDTVAFHLSVLKPMFPKGITVLSLFSGIGGAEVALHRLGIPLKNVVSVEISEVNRNILRCWWEQTNQTGNLIHIEDVQKLNGDRLEQLIDSFGGFDLIIGGSPCNNLSGANRVSRDGLEGDHSNLFYDYYRILHLVKDIMGRNAWFS